MATVSAVNYTMNITIVIRKYPRDLGISSTVCHVLLLSLHAFRCFGFPWYTRHTYERRKQYHALWFAFVMNILL